MHSLFLNPYSEAPSEPAGTVTVTVTVTEHGPPLLGSGIGRVCQPQMPSILRTVEANTVLTHPCTRLLCVTAFTPGRPSEAPASQP